MSWVRLRVFDKAIDAHILKTKLESEGILVNLLNENLHNLYGTVMSTFGGVQLLVSENDLIEAQKILEAYEKSGE